MPTMSLKRLHDDKSLVEDKLEKFRKLSTEEIVKSLRNEGPERLRIRKDGTVLQGNHRIKVLEERDYDTMELIPFAEVLEQE